MKNGSTYFKYSVILIGIAVIVWVVSLFKCNGSGGKEIKNDTVSYTRDTIIYVHDTTIVYKPQPYKEEIIRDSIIYLERQPEFKDFPPIAQRWIEEYHKRKFYDTTFNVQYGTARIIDTIYKNRLTGRSFSLQQSIPEITNTVTLREPKRVKGMIGLGIAGNIIQPLSQTEVSFGLLMKNNSYYGIKGILQKEGTTLYGVEFKRIISFRKR